MPRYQSAVRRRPPIVTSCIRRVHALNIFHQQGSRRWLEITDYQLILLTAFAVCVGCGKSTSNTTQKGESGDAPKKQFLSMGTAPVGGAFPVVGGAIAEVLNAHKDKIDWKVQAKGTKGSQENIRRLQQNELELALIQRSDLLLCRSR